MDSLTFWNSLSQIRGFGPKTLATIARAMLDAGLDGGKTGFDDIKKLGLRTTLLTKIEQALPLSASLIELPAGVRVLTPDDDLYPHHLLAGPIPPPVILYTMGNTQLLRAPSISVSGSRHAHPSALQYANQIAETAALKGLNIVSGFAAGIDRAAHEAALGADGTTVAVLAEGLAAKKAILQDDQVHSVLLVSQFPPDSKWSPHNAMQRNSTIASLSQAVVVVSAGFKGGSWEQAQLCLREEVPLGVPSFDSNIAEGNQALIDQGATPLDPAFPDQVLDLLPERQMRSETLF